MAERGDVKEKSVGGGLDYITMQFPICKFMGGSIGMLPYSSVGYAFGGDIAHGAMQNQGSGGINQGLSGRGRQSGGFSLGVNVAYSFGNIINGVFSSPVTSGQTLFEHVMKIRDWDISIGAQYTARVSRNDRITAGLTFTPKKSLHGDTGYCAGNYAVISGRHCGIHENGWQLLHAYDHRWRHILQA